MTRQLITTLLTVGLAFSITAACGNNEDPATGNELPAPTASSSIETPSPATQPEEKKVTAISLQPETIELAPGESATFAVTPTLDSEQLSDLVYLSSDQEAVSFSEGGVAVAAGDAVAGTVVELTVKFNELEAHAAVTIKPSLQGTLEPAEDGAIPVVSNHTSLQVMVNKDRSLPDGYEPDDLVVPDVPFSFEGESEKKQLRQAAAEALEELFAQAEEDGIELRAVSGYRSYGTQKAIYNYNLKTYGEEHTKRYSAYPGTSEHQTGLAMDVSSPSVGNALEDVLGDTMEGQWLAENAPTYGFIIRYPEGKEDVTGYAYEPWHLRYVGTPMSEEIAEAGLALEEYFGEAVAAGSDL